VERLILLSSEALLASRRKFEKLTGERREKRRTQRRVGRKRSNSRRGGGRKAISHIFEGDNLQGSNAKPKVGLRRRGRIVGKEEGLTKRGGKSPVGSRSRDHEGDRD